MTSNHPKFVRNYVYATLHWSSNVILTTTWIITSKDAKQIHFPQIAHHQCTNGCWSKQESCGVHQNTSFENSLKNFATSSTPGLSSKIQTLCVYEQKDDKKHLFRFYMNC
jgi:hypothetical protein